MKKVLPILLLALFPSDPVRVYIQMRSATRDFAAHHDAVRFMKWTRHALVPALDRRNDPTICWTGDRWEQSRKMGQ